MKKLILASTILGLLAMTLSVDVSAKEDSSQVDLDVIQSRINDNAGKYGNIVYGGDIVVNGETENLFFEYEDVYQSLEKFKDIHKDILAQIEKKYGLEELSIDNWKLYTDKINEYKNDTAILDESGNQTLSNEDEVMEIEKFFDIFENKFENDKIKNIVTNAQLKKASVNEEEAALLLPNYSPRVESFVANNLETQNNFRKAENLARINNKGVEYATRYATSRNRDYADLTNWGGDCTNFASQILAASGVRQVTSTSKYKGWWHRRTAPSAHEHSNSWIRADTFARYMGVGYKTRSHTSFAANIKKYDFIAYDNTGDGKWDHMAYVTADDNYIGSYGYYDYKVAQHSIDYHAWASSSTNKWDTTKGGIYGRVRR